MIHVEITAELPADESGPNVVYTERVTLPDDFATTVREAHTRILSELWLNAYVELPQRDREGPVPFQADTVRLISVWTEDP